MTTRLPKNLRRRAGLESLSKPPQERACPGCGRPLGSNWSEDAHQSGCPAVYEPGTAAFHELTEMKIDRLLGN